MKLITKEELEFMLKYAGTCFGTKAELLTINSAIASASNGGYSPYEEVPSIGRRLKHTKMLRELENHTIALLWQSYENRKQNHKTHSKSSYWLHEC